MLQATFSFSKKDHALLGKLLLKNKPDIAQELIKTYLPEQPPKESDFSKIKDLFSRFCKIQNIEPEEHLGPVYKSDKVSMRRLFVATMVHLYNPQVYFQPLDSIVLSNGFVTAITRVLSQNKGNTSKMIREVIIWEKQYEDFATSVSQTITKLTTDAGAQGK